MTWSWYYLIPLAFMLIIAVIWLIVFFMSYKNGKNVKSAVNDAKEVIEAFKGDTGMSNLKYVLGQKTEEVTTTPAEPAKAATEAASAPAVAEVAAAAETPVAAENKAAEMHSYVNNFYRAIEAAIEDMTDETEIKKLLNKLASKLT